MEVRLPDEVLKDIVEPGKTFKRQLEPENQGEENSKRPLASLIIEKMADNVIKIIVKVHTPEGISEAPESSTKSELQQNEVSNSAQQTENAETENRLMQTDQKVEKTQTQQTDQTSGKSQEQQTDKKVCKETGFQTIKKQFKDNEMQTDLKNYTESNSQTEIKEYKESSFQTDIKEYRSNFCQTVVKEYCEILCQTNFSLANLRESECQATVLGCDSECQTLIETSDNYVQATASSSEGFSQTELVCSETSVQTEKDEGTLQCQTILSMLEMVEGGSQTDIETSSSDCQTESSMALQEEFACQMAPEMNTNDTQTEIAVRTAPCQTEYSSQSAETQTLPDVNNRETQTDQLVTVTLSNDPAPSEQPQEMHENVMAEEPLAAIQEDGTELLLPSADMIQSITPLAVVPFQPKEPGINVTVQTEPVTIIIGDAGFLVQKLKGTAVKTETHDREFEIEFAKNGSPPPSTTKGRGRSGYIPGSRLASSITSPPPPLLSTINPDSLRGTPVRPFNPKEITSIEEYIKPAQSNTVPPKPRRFIKDSPVATPAEVPRVASPRPAPTIVKQRPPASPPAKIQQELNCPFCEGVFHHSGSLYKHITSEHKEQRQAVHRKPQGRPLKQRVEKPSPRAPEMDPNMPDHVRQSVERYRKIALAKGQTPPGNKTKRRSVQDRAHSSDGYSSPPVLEPVYRVNQVRLVGDEGEQITHSSSVRTYKRRAPVAQPEPSLFEDLPEPTRAYPRGRVRREEDQEEVVSKQQADAYEYECPHCPERYGSASHLYGHLKRSHKNEMEQQRQAETVAPKRKKQHATEKAQEENSLEESVEEGQHEAEEDDVGEEGEEVIEQEEEVQEEEDEEHDIEEETAAGEEEEGVEEEAQEEEEEAAEEEPAEDGEAEEAPQPDEEVEKDVEEEPEEEEAAPEPEEPSKRKRRPAPEKPVKRRKYDDVSDDEAPGEEPDEEMPVLEPPRKRTGRPRRQAVQEEPELTAKRPGRAKKTRKA